MKKSGTTKAKPKGTKAGGKSKKTAAMPAAKTAKARKTSAPKAKAPAAKKAAAPKAKAKAKAKPAPKAKPAKQSAAPKAKGKSAAKSKAAGNGRVPASKASSSKSDPYKLRTLKDAARKDDRSAFSSLGYQVARALVNVPKPEIRDTLADGVESAMKVAKNKRVKDTLAKLAKQLRAPAK